MESAHLRLVAVGVDTPIAPLDAELWGCLASHRSMGLVLDRRVAELRHAARQSAALIGFALLPWCDVTLWGVAAPLGQMERVDGVEWPRVPSRGHERACARLRVEVEHIDWALAYVERLPVERALVAKAWRWRWSSAAWHCGFGAKPSVLAPEWSGPIRRDLWRERLAGAFLGRSDRSVPIEPAAALSRKAPQIIGSAIDRLSWRDPDRSPSHSPGIPPPEMAGTEEIEPSHGELAVA